MTKPIDYLIDDLMSDVRQVQNSSNNGVIYFSHDPTGLGAQLSRRILGLKIGYLTRKKAFFPSESMYPYENCFADSLNEGEVSSDYVSSLPEFDVFNYAEGVSYRFDFWKFWSNSEAKAAVYGYIPDCLKGVGNAERIFEGCLLNLFQLKPEYDEFVAEARARLGLLDGYISIHYRRGDKKVETPYVPTEVYRNELIGQLKKTGVAKVFVASDSPYAVNDLALSGDVVVVFDGDEIRYNNANHKFLMKNRGLSKQETLTAIKNIMLLSGGVRVVGQDNAHFATLASSVICLKNGGDDYGRLIPGQLLFEKKSVYLRYKLKEAIKKLVKRILPGLTLRNRKR